MLCKNNMNDKEDRNSTCSTVSEHNTKTKKNSAPICMFYFSHPFGISTPCHRTVKLLQQIPLNESNKKWFQFAEFEYFKREKTDGEPIAKNFSVHKMTYVPWPQSTWEPIPSCDMILPNIGKIVSNVETQSANLPISSKVLLKKWYPPKCKLPAQDNINTDMPIQAIDGYDHKEYSKFLRRTYSVPEIIMRKHHQSINHYNETSTSYCQNHFVSTDSFIRVPSENIQFSLSREIANDLNTNNFLNFVSDAQNSLPEEDSNIPEKRLSQWQMLRKIRRQQKRHHRKHLRNTRLSKWQQLPIFHKRRLQYNNNTHQILMQNYVNLKENKLQRDSSISEKTKIITTSALTSSNESNEDKCVSITDLRNSMIVNSLYPVTSSAVLLSENKSLNNIIQNIYKELPETTLSSDLKGLTSTTDTIQGVSENMCECINKINTCTSTAIPYNQDSVEDHNRSTSTSAGNLKQDIDTLPNILYHGEGMQLQNDSEICWPTEDIIKYNIISKILYNNISNVVLMGIDSPQVNYNNYDLPYIETDMEASIYSSISGNMITKIDGEDIIPSEVLSDKFDIDSLDKNYEGILLSSGNVEIKDGSTTDTLLTKIDRLESLDTLPMSSSILNHNSTTSGEISDESTSPDDSLNEPQYKTTHNIDLDEGKQLDCETQMNEKENVHKKQKMYSYFVVMIDSKNKIRRDTILDNIPVSAYLPKTIRDKLHERRIFKGNRNIRPIINNHKEKKIISTTKLEMVNTNKMEREIPDSIYKTNSEESYGVMKKNISKQRKITNYNKNATNGTNKKAILQSEINKLESYTIDSRGKININRNSEHNCGIRSQTLEVNSKYGQKYKKGMNLVKMQSKLKLESSQGTHKNKKKSNVKNIITLSHTPNDLITPDTDCGPKRKYEKTEIHDGDKRIEILEIVECYDKYDLLDSSEDITRLPQETETAITSEHTPVSKSKIPIPIFKAKSAFKNGNIRNLDQVIAEVLIGALRNSKKFDYMNSQSNILFSDNDIPLPLNVSVINGSGRSTKSCISKYQHIFDDIPEEKPIGTDLSSTENSTLLPIMSYKDNIDNAEITETNNHSEIEEVDWNCMSNTSNSNSYTQENVSRINYVPRGKLAVQSEATELEAWLKFFKCHDESPVSGSPVADDDDLFVKIKQKTQTVDNHANIYELHSYNLHEIDELTSVNDTPNTTDNPDYINYLPFKSYTPSEQLKVCEDTINEQVYVQENKRREQCTYEHETEKIDEKILIYDKISKERSTQCSFENTNESNINYIGKGCKFCTEIEKNNKGEIPSDKNHVIITKLGHHNKKDKLISKSKFLRMKSYKTDKSILNSSNTTNKHNCRSSVVKDLNCNSSSKIDILNGRKNISLVLPRYNIKEIEKDSIPKSQKNHIALLNSNNILSNSREYDNSNTSSSSSVLFNPSSHIKVSRRKSVEKNPSMKNISKDNNNSTSTVSAAHQNFAHIKTSKSKNISYNQKKFNNFDKKGEASDNASGWYFTLAGTCEDDMAPDVEMRICFPRNKPSLKDQIHDTRRVEEKDFFFSRNDEVQFGVYEQNANKRSNIYSANVPNYKSYHTMKDFQPKKQYLPHINKINSNRDTCQGSKKKFIQLPDGRKAAPSSKLISRIKANKGPMLPQTANMKGLRINSEKILYQDQPLEIGNFNHRQNFFPANYFQPASPSSMALSILGNAISPEQKPRVQTMSERDLTRRHNSCFIRNFDFFT